MGAGLAIFDCDGVLVDSDRIALRIQAERITALGLPPTHEECARDFLGLGMPATLRILEGAVAAGMTALGYAADGDGEGLARAGATVFTAMSELPALIRSTCPP